MGIYYGVTVGYGFEVPLHNIQNLPEYSGGNYAAEEALDSHLYKNGYEYLTPTSAHAYDAGDEETQFAIGIKRLTKGYGDNESFSLVVLEDKVVDLAPGEEGEVRKLLAELDMPQETPLVPFVASWMI